MSLTRANVESVIIRRAGRKMTAAGLDGVTITGANLDLNDPIRTALLQMQITPAGATITDADIAGVTDEAQLMDLIELRTLESILNNLDLVDITVGPRRESLSQLGTQIEATIARLYGRISLLYGLGIGTLSGGVISLDFASKGDDTIEDSYA